MVDILPIRNIGHVELWVGNAKQAAYYYRKAFGFSQVAYAGPETGLRDRASYVLRQHKITLVLTTPLSSEHPINAHLKKHGDGVRDISFSCDDADACFALAIERGAEVAEDPHDVTDAHGTMRRAAIKTYGDTIHSFISSKGYEGPFLPGYEEALIEEQGVGLLKIDHIVGNVEEGKMQRWCDFYTSVLGFEQFLSFDDKDISTEFTALRSKVMTSPNKVVKFPINEPAAGRKKSQIQEYIEFYEGAGAQHIALLTEDEVKTVAALRARGVEFLDVPDSYYQAVWDRVGVIEENREEIRRERVLVDRDDKGYLLQLFTKPVEDRPTLFFEIIQRRGSQSFGKGNFRALFESIEREQERRGNL
ncbi:MAG: 4-hydroxyphenylpyruvate dioxygenase [Deltaproteobacteria bacterium]|nr:4-hydroxyphenylpyruvate dioxygenase [Deltaproteobacteria bacterium]